MHAFDLKSHLVHGYPVLLLASAGLGYASAHMIGMARYEALDAIAFFSLIVLFPAYILADAALNARLASCAVRAAMLPLPEGIVLSVAAGWSDPLFTSLQYALLYAVASLLTVALVPSTYERKGGPSASGAVAVHIISWLAVLYATWNILNYLFAPRFYFVSPGSSGASTLSEVVQFLMVAGLGAVQIFLALRVLKRRPFARLHYIGFAALLICLQTIQILLHFLLRWELKVGQVLLSIIGNGAIIYLLFRRDIDVYFAGQTAAGSASSPDEDAVDRSTDPAARQSAELPSGLSGVHGWLKFIVVSNLYVAPALFASCMVVLWIVTITIAHIHPANVLASLFDTIAGGYLVWRAMRVAIDLRDVRPRAVHSAIKVLRLALILSFLSIPVQMISGLNLDSPLPSAPRTFLFALAGFAFWTSYFDVSQRVRGTYPDWTP